METENYSDEMVNYIYGDLSEQEKAVFEEKMRSDPDLAIKMSRLKEIIDKIKLGVRFEEILNDPGYEWAESEATKAVEVYARQKRREFLLSKTFRRKYVYPVAASFLVLYYVGNFIFFLQKPELAFDKYYRDYTPEYYEQSTLDEAQVLFMHSLDEYSNGNYEAVADNMHTLMEKGELNTRGQIMLAFYDLWMHSLNFHFDAEKTEEDATWYLAFTSLKLHELQKAQALFSKLSSESSARGRRAERMEIKINKMLLAE